MIVVLELLLVSMMLWVDKVDRLFLVERVIAFHRYSLFNVC